tara:strand:- start:673 stop:1671 length:999 start_codon:yes stop_codon:yes gene_type:complete
MTRDVSFFWIFIIFQYIFFGNFFYEYDIFRGKSDDVIIAAAFFMCYFRFKIFLNIFVIFLIFLVFIISAWLVFKYENILYWFYLLFCWSILLFAPKKIEINKKNTFLITYIFFLMWYLYLGPSVKSFNIDVNVLHIFLLMTVIVLCISGPFMKIFTTILVSFLSGTRSTSVMISYSFLRSYFFYIVICLYVLGYIFSLIFLDNNPSNAARSGLIVNHFLNYTQLSQIEILFGAGPQAYMNFNLLIDTSITFVNSKPKTVDSSLLRMLLEFGLIGTIFLLYFIYKYINSFKLFLLFIICMGLSNEGMLSIYGPLSLLILKSINHNTPHAKVAK